MSQKRNRASIIFTGHKAVKMTACRSKSQHIPYIQLEELRATKSLQQGCSRSGPAHQRTALLHVPVFPIQQEKSSSSRKRKRACEKQQKRSHPFSLHLSREKERSSRNYTALWSEL
uniref:Uncharacterized protein n=1 Tax=Arundo donax TaxID=35708 RepID=A0A0A9F0Z8_ARUDO